jgi:D-amino-acid dehydrogenase
VKIVVLGAGVIGITSAYALAKAGHDVTVVDRQDEPAAETSFANGGIIHISLVDPWNAPGIARNLVQWLGREDSPALIRPAALPGLMRWGLAFLRNSTPERHRRHTLANLRLALLSAAALKQVRAETGIAYDHAERGLLKIFRDRASLDHAQAFARVLEPHGVRYSVLDVPQVIDLEPALLPVQTELTGGILFPDDETGDAGLFTRALAEVAAARHGVAYRFGVTALGLETEGERILRVRTSAGPLGADAIVLALGSYSPIVAKTARLRLPIYPVKGYSLTVPIDGWNSAPRMPIADEGLKVGVVPLGDRLRIAGSAEFAGYDRKPHARRARYIWTTATKVYPALRDHADPDAILPWSGLRPMTADGPPIIGRTPFRNLFLNTGHGHLGWTMACGSAEILAALVDGRPPPIALDGLTYDRYGRA